MVDGRFLCLDLETKEEIWARLYSSSFSGASVGIGKVLVVTSDDVLRCLDADSGDELWTYPLDVYYRDRPVAIADGRVYVSGEDHAVLCIGEAPVTVSGSLNCNPVSGTLPFQTNMSLTLHNSYLNQARRGAVSIAVTLGNGTWFPNWRTGYTNLERGASRVLLWQTTIPDYPPLGGENTFQLLVEDVTPAPYNQPPYPPAGDTCTDLAVVTGISP
jgi:hypothetical protein